jgi:hypothetical protein
MTVVTPIKQEIEPVAEKIPELKIFKIDNPNWLGMLGPQIKVFADKINLPTLTYETLYTYFLRTVQFGGGRAEFWVVSQGEEVVAFAHWYVCDLPHRGVVFMDFIHSWNRMRKPVMMLLDKYIEFGKKNHAPIYKGTAINETVFRVFRKAASKWGYELHRTELVDFLGRKK